MRLFYALIAFILRIETAWAQAPAPPAAPPANPGQINVGQFSFTTFTNTTQVLNSVISFLVGSIFWVAAAMFAVGGLMMVFGGGSEKSKSWGKDLMIGSIVGMGVVLGAYAIYQTAVWILYLA